MTTKWHKGPPPEIGWWPASVYEDANWLRWWDGEYWSISVNSVRSAEYAGQAAKIEVVDDRILWAERWWLK